MPMSCCMCKPMETAQSLWRRLTCGGYTAKVGMRARGRLRVVPNVGLRAWPMDVCSNRDAGKSESKTPTPCECEQARRQIKIRQDNAVEVHVNDVHPSCGIDNESVDLASALAFLRSNILDPRGEDMIRAPTAACR